MTGLLVIDDDATFGEVVCRALCARGFEARHAASSAQAFAMALEFGPEYVLLDLKIHHESGLTLIPELLRLDPFTRIVVLTGYASIATAVEAIKLGAVHYLAKPAELEQIIAAFEKTGGDPLVPVTRQAQTVSQVEWEHIRAALARNQGNISATARELRMHRRTLQRKMDKMPPRL